MPARERDGLALARSFAERALATRLLHLAAMLRFRRDGFSLLELLAALGVMSLLAAVALPRVSGVLPALLLDQAARQLVSDLELTRLKAIHRNHRVRALFD